MADLEIVSPEEGVKDWNKKYPVGTKVTVLRDNGEELETETRSLAELLPSGHPVIWVKGITGCYHLGRVCPKDLEQI